MKNLLLFVVALGLCSCRETPKTSEGKQVYRDHEMEYIEDWFDAWEVVSDSLKIKSESVPVMLFFDKEFSYTNSDTEIKNSTRIHGPSFMGQVVKWKKRKHNDTIRLPGGQGIPAGILSFAVPIDDANRRSYFVMALPSVWEDAKIGSEELGDNNFYTSIFLHEFAHSQQSRNFGKKLDRLDRKYNFESDLNDDMIQGEFASDSLYTKLLKSEIELFYDAYFVAEEKNMRSLVLKGFDLYNERQKRFFKDKRKIYGELDDFFLTMEGIGQYVAYVWLTSKQGVNLSSIKAIDRLRRKRDNWAQDESLALFLIYARLADPDWDREMFGSEVFEIKTLIQERLE